MKYYEVNFDGLIGPNHNYGGLALGNIASLKNRKAKSNPRAAALQGLEKMKFLSGLGIKQAILPPQERPAFKVLRNIGFTGSDREIIRKAWKKAPEILTACYSSSAMWTANAATISPSPDTRDKRVHITPANLLTLFHRSIEADFTVRVLKRIFANERYFKHHAPFPAQIFFSDEGAANHIRLCTDYGRPGIEIFAFGFKSPHKSISRLFPRRQSYYASRAVARLHSLDPNNTQFFEQHPKAINHGVFHNDVICVADRNLILLHQQAFKKQERKLRLIKELFYRQYGKKLQVIQIASNKLSMRETVRTYFFNSQIVSPAKDKAVLILPQECRESKNSRKMVESLISAKNPIQEAHYINLNQSMKNGGGPACLRLRAVLSEVELNQVHPGVVFDQKLFARLKSWINRHYRDLITPADLADYQLALECRAALEELAKILSLGKIYSFQ